MEIEISTVHEGWASILEVFRSPAPIKVPSRHGVVFDIPSLTVVVRDPADTRPPKLYAFPVLLKDYRERVFGEQRGNSLLYQRLTAWRPTATSRKLVNQLDALRLALRKDEATRAAVFSLWLPGVDSESPHPVSPVAGSFRILNDELNAMIVARSVDVWTGLVPELLVFCQLATDVASDLGLPRTRLVYHAWSAHIYEVDYIQSVLGGVR